MFLAAENLKSFVTSDSIPVTSLPLHPPLVCLLTCSSFSLGEIRSGGFPSRFVQDVEWIVDLGVRRVERAQAADGADDGHVLVNQ